MKKILFFLSFLICLIPFTVKANSAQLDEILNYSITVHPRDDGTLDMEYQISWKVLDSSSEGPLEWVKIGVPNKHVDQIVALSNPISKIKYFKDDGTYIRIDLDKSYYKGSVVDLHFSFHQSYIYTVDEENVYYAFKPGWFDEIDVNKLTVKWKSANALYYNSDIEENGYIIWEEENLKAGETIITELMYSQKTFPNIDLEKVYTEPKDNSWIMILIILCSVFIFIMLIVIFSTKASKSYGDGYYYYRGFSYYYYRRYSIFRRPGVTKDGKKIPTVVNSSGSNSRSGGSSSCACACACACAGGGRAGCSRKDFYNPKFVIDDAFEDL